MCIKNSKPNMSNSQSNSTSNKCGLLHYFKNIKKTLENVHFFQHVNNSIITLLPSSQRPTSHCKKCNNCTLFLFGLPQLF